MGAVQAAFCQWNYVVDGDFSLARYFINGFDLLCSAALTHLISSACFVPRALFVSRGAVTPFASTPSKLLWVGCALPGDARVLARPAGAITRLTLSDVPVLARLSREIRFVACA